MNFSRYLDATQFAHELGTLHAYRGEYVGDRLLESLECARLVIPRIRIRYPEPVARRLWLENHEDVELINPIEPDGDRWDAAIELANGIFRWRNAIAYGLLPHPLDDPDPCVAEFVEHPAELAFVPWREMCIDVSNNIDSELYDSSGVATYYSSWQLLLAVEVAAASIHFRIDLANKNTAEAARKALGEDKASSRAYVCHGLPVHATQGFAKHEPALNAVVWFAEECERALSDILKNHVGQIFRLSEEQNAHYKNACTDAANSAARRYRVDENGLIELCKFLSAQWDEWNGEGRPLIATAYKAFLAQTVRVIRRISNQTFQEVSLRVGHPGGWLEPIFDSIWPNWAEQEKNRVRSTLKSSFASNPIASVDDTCIDAFVDFIPQKGLEAFFWRLNSFDHHARHGNEFSLEGMKSDLQGMAVVVEHITIALGADVTQTQLYEKFKQLWHASKAVLEILKRDDVSKLARQMRFWDDWPALKCKIAALRNENGGNIAADLVMAHRIRGGVHLMFPNDDRREMEILFLTLMRAAVLTFSEVQYADAVRTK